MAATNVYPFAHAESESADEALMVACAGGDLKAFEVLVKRHQNRIYRMAYHMLGSEEDAWDVSQEIFIKVHHARASYVENAKFTTWLYRIANNAVIDKIRQRKRHSQVSSIEDNLVEPSSEGDSPQRLIELHQLKGRLAEALVCLSERQRGMLILRYFEGLSVNEIAEIADCAVGTVKATLFQSLRNLRSIVEKLGITDSEVSA